MIQWVMIATSLWGIGRPQIRGFDCAADLSRSQHKGSGLGGSIVRKKSF
jgi:hypothetical protein